MSSLIPRTTPILLLVLLFTSRVWADPALRLGPREAVVLLRNGQVLHGKVAREGNHYSVVLKDGDIRIKVSDVDKVCDNLDQAYERQREKVEVGRVTDHLNLADWCLRHKLLGYAANEIRQAMRADASHPRLKLLERRLELAQRESTAVHAPRKTVAPGPSGDDLDRLIRGMPAGTVETFTTQIQPLLLNSCSTAGCHGPASQSKLRLIRVAAGKTASRRTTQRNLYAVLEFITTGEGPESSLLLKESIRKHGTTKAPVFTHREAKKYQELAAWVQAVSNGKTTRQTSVNTVGFDESQPAIVEHPESPTVGSARKSPFGFQADERATRTKSARTSKPAENGKEEPTDSYPASDENISEADEEPRAAKSSAGDDRAKGYVPLDPFDPEMFNRRYLSTE